MKKLGVLGLLAFAGIALASCSSNAKDGVITKDIYGKGVMGTTAKVGRCGILFKENSTIPYIPLEDGAKLLDNVRKANLDDIIYGVKYEKKGDEFVLTNDAGAKCVINGEKQTISFDDYDAYSSVVPNYQKPLSILTLKKTNKALKLQETKFTPGKSVTVELNKYPKLDIYVKNDKCFLPLSVFNSLLLNAFENVNLAYNGKNYFVISGRALSTEILGMVGPTDLGEKIHEGVEGNTITEEYADYVYQSLCFDFDQQYGLTSKFTSFDDFITKNGWKDKFKTTDPKTIDKYLGIALTHLKDGHTALTDFSYLYEFADNTIDKDKINKEKAELDNAEEAFTALKKQSGIKEGLKYYKESKTAFVTFDSFTNVDLDTLYGNKTDTGVDDDDYPDIDFNSYKEADLSNTAVLFAQLYKDLTSDEYKNSIKNVVIDITSNTGGNSDGLIYALSCLVGEAKVDMINPKTNAHNYQVYKADINVDGVVDDKDIPLTDLGFNIYILGSRYSFSSANALAVLAKNIKPTITTIGDKTGGGPCAVRVSVTQIGSMYLSSGLNVIAKKKDNSYVNIDDGVDADFKLTEAQMINREYILENISKWVRN